MKYLDSKIEMNTKEYWLNQALYQQKKNPQIM